MSKPKEFLNENEPCKEMGYILSSGPKPLKLSQEKLQPSGVNETLRLLCFLSSPITSSYLLTACLPQLMLKCISLPVCYSFSG